MPDSQTSSTSAALEHDRQPAAPVPGRPNFAPGYGIDPLATEGVLPWSELVARMEGARNYWICTTRPDGRPHAAPVWGLWFEDEFVFSTGTDSRKGRNLALSPEVVVHLESGDDVVILDGTVEIVPVAVADAAWLARFADAYSAKYAIKMDFAAMGADMAAALYRLHPRTAFAWLESAFPATATRFTMAG
jgi:PPOX class probable F420-dependent enzyme